MRWQQIRHGTKRGFDQSITLYFFPWPGQPNTTDTALQPRPDRRGRRSSMYLCKTFNPYTHLPINVILAKTFGKYFKPEEKQILPGIEKPSKLLPWKILAGFMGNELADIRYEQLLPFDSKTLEHTRKHRAPTPSGDHRRFRYHGRRVRGSYTHHPCLWRR